MNKNFKKLIFIQLNEINFDIIKKFYKNKNYKVINNIIKGLKYTKSETKYNLLEPWIQWFSIFSGLSAKQHKIFRLGDGINFKKKLLYNIIEKNGYSVGAISPMNVKNNLKNPSYFIPDPWTKTKSDNSYSSQQFSKILRNTVNNNANNKISIEDYFKLILFALTNVRFKDYVFFSELLISSFKDKWKKALILDFIIHSMHLNLLKKKNPNFSTIFFNAGAHIQHHYLFNSRVNKSNLKNPNFKAPSNKDPFNETIRFYDRILKDYFDIYDAELVIATGLTQKMVKKIDYYYRLKDHGEFLKKVNINFKKIQPLMSRDFVISFYNNKSRDKAAKILNSIKLNKKKLFGIINKKNNSIFVSLTYDKEIKKKDFFLINDKLENYLYNDVSFVALKNAIHYEKGFLFNRGSIKFKNNLNIVNIKDKIIDYFKK